MLQQTTVTAVIPYYQKFLTRFPDIKSLAKPVFRHRLVLNFHARADGVDTETIIDRLLKAVPQEG